MASAQSEHLSQFRFRWEYVLASGVFAGVVAVVGSSLAALKPQRYSQLIVGNLAWQLGLKQPDYMLLLSLVVGFFLVYTGFYYLSNFICKRNGELAEIAFRHLLALSLLPMGMLLGKVIVNADDIILAVAIEFLAGSLLLLLATVGFAIGLARKRVSDVTEPEYIEVVGGSLLLVFFSLFAGSALALAIGRVHLPWQLKSIGTVALVTGIGAILLWLPLLKIWLERGSDFNQFRTKLRRQLWAVQGFLPLFFLVLLPLPWMNGKDKLYGYPITPALLVLIGSCVTIAYIDWIRRFKPSIAAERISTVFTAVSPIGLIALLLYIKAIPVIASAALVDDYHSGEFFLPWWLWQNFHYIPFWDYEPARGLVNYVVGLFAHLFFDDTSASYQAAASYLNALLMLPYLSITFLVLRRTIGIMPAFLACLLMPIGNGLFEIDCMVTVVLCVLGNAFLRQRWAGWIAIWGVTSVAILLFAPGQGGLLILSTLPLAGFACFKAAFKERQQLVMVIAGGLLLLLLLSLATPLGKMLVGAVRYGAEQSSINSVSNGIPWSDSASTNPVLSYALWEVVRTAWVLVGITAGLWLFRAFVDKTWLERTRYAVFGSPIFLLMVLFIPRAAGRIDAGQLSRLGEVSAWAICLLLPIALFAAYGQRKQALRLLVLAFLGGIVVGLPAPESLLGKPVRVVDVSTLSDKTADRLGLPNLAHTLIDPAQLDRLQQIKPILQATIDPGETYLDLTNHNADYFYFGYPSPVQAGAFYNLPHRNQQIRAVQKLEASPPPIVLASADNMLFDGGTAALRAHLLYRYVAERYTPIAVDKFIYMVRPDRLERLKSRLTTIAPSATVTVGDTPEARLNLLDQVFLVEKLEKIPRAWGLSFESLRSTLQPIKTLDETAIVTLQGVERIGQATYRITGKNPSITFNVANLNLNGRDAGILAFDFASDSAGTPVKLAVDWQSGAAASSNTKPIQFSAKQSKVLVPLDAAPRWLLANGMKTIRVAIAEPAPCKTFTIANITLFQRSEIQTMPKSS